MAPLTTTKPPPPEGPKTLQLDDSSRKSSLVTGELADLEAMRTDGKSSKIRAASTNCWDDLQYSLRIVRQNPRILFISFIVFAILCGGGLGLVFFLANDQDNDEKDSALDLAIETGRWFADQLNRAILPLFSLAQFVGELDSFNALADRVGARPSLPPLEPNGVITHREVDGVCDDPDVLNRFNGIAESIKEDADMAGVLVSLQLVPDQVVCMVYPMINTEDFKDGIVQDNRGAIGLDLVAIPSRTAYSESVLSSKGIYIAGPLTLEECSGDGGDCNVSVEKAFIAALPVNSDNHTISVGRTTFQRWGSVEAVINWNELIERSDIFERFASDGKGFKLTRTDRTVDPNTDEVTSVEVILAETEDFDSPKYVQVSTTLDTVDDMWQMTIAYEKASNDWLPYGIASTVLLSFFFAALVFMIMLQKQKFVVMQKRYLEDLAHPQKLRLRMFLDVQDNAEPTAEMEAQILNKKPIADFFPQCTVLMADIAGFTSWSSEREPSQVFQLLQTVFFHFDKICRKRNVFKVETTGDVYVVVSGVPEPQPDHAVRMTKFAQECLTKFNSLTRELEKQLGPETHDLKMRIGLSSGPVVGGVLLGGESKFHIFGTTVNTAARMEATSEPDRIHLSEKTAELLLEAGKKKWVKARKEKILVKGVGDIQTYFITQRKSHQVSVPQANKNSKLDNKSSDTSFCSDLSVGSGDLWDEDDPNKTMVNTIITFKGQRLIDWQVESLGGLLKKIVAYRNQGRKKKVETFSLALPKGETVLDEVQEIIELPEFDNKKSTLSSDVLASVELSPAVKTQLRAYVEEIASVYHDNPFHNFEHANHVTMAVHKLLNRIVTPEDVNYERKNAKKVAEQLHEYTFGITSDPLTHFAVVFSALIHDTDHRGVSNPQLAKEIPQLGEKYRNKSVAEQNSVDMSWDMLMKPKYADLQKCIFTTKEEYARFRQLVVNTVLATDIFDPELKALRNMRWDRAFHSDELQRDFEGSSNGEFSTGGDDSERDTDPTDPDVSESAHSASTSKKSGDSPDDKKQRKQTSTNRRATIVIEHIIQASDVAHTMQHWNVYKRWNEKLFQEMYVAYKLGRSPKDPSLGWYNGELWFFDNYVIPLAKKLDECGVFGVASDECLFNAIENRREWALKGESVVEEMLERCKEMGLDQLASVVEEDEEQD